MKNFLITSGVIATILLTGCGGGGGGTSDSSLDSVISYDIQSVDIEDKAKISIEKENAKEIYNASKLFFSLGSGIGKGEVVSILEEHVNSSQKCLDGGYIAIKTVATNNQVIVQYDQCNIGDSIILDGEINYVLDKTINTETADYLIGKNLTITIDGHSVVFDYTIRAFRSDETEIDYWDYYIRSEDLLTKEKSEVNLHIYHKDEFYEMETDVNGEPYEILDPEETNISGTYLINDEEYFTLSSSGLQSDILGWFGLSEEQLYHPFVSPGSALIFEGKETTLRYQGATEGNIFILEDQSNIYYAKEAEPLSWSTDLNTLIENTEAPRLSVRFGNNTKFKSITDSLLFNENKTMFKTSFIDFDDLGEYRLKIKLLAKPEESRLEFNVEKTLFSSNDIIETNLNLDAFGRYFFNITLQDGEYLVEKNVTLEYYDTNLSNEQFEYSGNISDTVLLSQSNAFALLDSGTESKLTLFDTENHILSALLLPSDTFKMALSEDEKFLAISANEKVYLVDISDTNHPFISKTFDVPSKLGDIAIYDGYIYVLSYHGQWEELYSVKIESGAYTIVENIAYGQAKIELDSILHALYMIDDDSIARVDITSGDAKDYRNTFSAGYDKFCMGLWLLPADRVVTGCGIELAVSNAEAEDLRYIDVLDSSSLIKDSYGHYATMIRAFHKNEQIQKIALVTGERNYAYDTSLLEGYENRLEVYTAGSMALEKTVLLKKYWEEEGAVYALFVDDVKFISENKVLIIYKAMILSSTDADTGNKVIYELKTI